MELEWNLHYARWVIEDGQPDLHVGETFKWFAVSFWTEDPLIRTTVSKKSAFPVDDYRYRVVAELTYVTESACVIDFGLKATSSSDLLPARCEPGDYVSGIIGLNLPLITEVGPDDAFKVLARQWRVNRISADMTPYIPHPNYSGGSIRDVSRVRYSEVDDTNEVITHSYVLHCVETSMSMRESR